MTVWLITFFVHSTLRCVGASEAGLLILAQLFVPVDLLSKITQEFRFQT